MENDYEENNYLNWREQESCDHEWKYGMVILGQAITPRQCVKCGKKQI